MSVEVLRRVIDHFKAQDKHVVVVGYSYGSFLVARYLALHGPDAADRYLLMAGRLDMPPKFVNGALAGMIYHFPNAVNLELSDRRPTTDQESIELRIAGATFHDRYTERLSDTDLRKAIYVYATADTVVGRLAEPETAFPPGQRGHRHPRRGRQPPHPGSGPGDPRPDPRRTAGPTLTRPRPRPVGAPGTHREPREPRCKTGCPTCTNLRH